VGLDPSGLGGVGSSGCSAVVRGLGLHADDWSTPVHSSAKIPSVRVVDLTLAIVVDRARERKRGPLQPGLARATIEPLTAPGADMIA
jgi:hypothetical protein